MKIFFFDKTSFLLFYDHKLTDTYNLISLNNFKLKEETNKSLKAQEEGNQKIKQDLESKITGLRNNFENNNSSINQKINSVIMV